MSKKVKIKESKVKEEITTWICDMCGFSTTKNTGMCSIRPIMPCDICEKDFCENCRHLEYDYDDCVESIHCKECWEIGERYRTAIHNTRRAFEDREGELYQEWRNEALGRFKQDSKILKR